MNTLAPAAIIGIDVSRDWLDLHCLADGQELREPNTAEGHARVVALARERGALVGFEATGGQEWRLWAALDAEGIVTRQLPPAQVKAFARSQGTWAKTDRIDARLIARFLRFRPAVGRRRPPENLVLLRALTTKRGQLVELRKRLLTQIKTQGRTGIAGLFDDIDAGLKALLDARIKDLEARIRQAIAADEALTETARILRSIPGIGLVTSTMLIAEMPELGAITGGQAAALVGLAPIADDSGARRGKRAIAGRRRSLRQVLYQAGLVAAYHNPDLKAWAERLRDAGKPHKVVIVAVARKLVTIANALCKSRQKWVPRTA